MGHLFEHFWGIFEHFSKSVHQIFLKLYLLAGIEKQVKVTVFRFERKFILYSKQGKWVKCQNCVSIVRPMEFMYQFSVTRQHILEHLQKKNSLCHKNSLLAYKKVINTQFTMNIDILLLHLDFSTINCLYVPGHLC